MSWLRTDTGGGVSCFCTVARPGLVLEKSNRPEFRSSLCSKGASTFLSREFNDYTSVSVSMPPSFSISGEGLFKKLQEKVARSFFRNVAQGSSSQIFRASGAGAQDYPRSYPTLGPSQRDPTTRVGPDKVGLGREGKGRVGQGRER